MVKWEYKIFYIKDNLPEKRLKEIGLDGWEIYQICDMDYMSCIHAISSMYNYIIYAKRPMNDS